MYFELTEVRASEHKDAECVDDSVRVAVPCTIVLVPEEGDRMDHFMRNVLKAEKRLKAHPVPQSSGRMLFNTWAKVPGDQVTLVIREHYQDRWFANSSIVSLWAENVLNRPVLDKTPAA